MKIGLRAGHSDNRRIKTSTSLYEMNHIVAPNIIFEICFCDSEIDIAIYNKYSWDRLVHLFCNAIDSNIQKETNYINKETGYVVTNYLPMGIKVMEALKVLNVILEAILKSCGLKPRWLAIAKCYDLKDMLEELVLEYTIN